MAINTRNVRIRHGLRTYTCIAHSVQSWRKWCFGVCSNQHPKKVYQPHNTYVYINTIAQSWQSTAKRGALASAVTSIHELCILTNCVSTSVVLNVSHLGEAPPCGAFRTRSFTMVDFRPYY